MDNQPCTSKQALAQDAKMLTRSALRSARLANLKNTPLSKKNSMLTEVYQSDDKINDLLNLIDYTDGLMEKPAPALVPPKLSCADTESDCSWSMLLDSPTTVRTKKLTKSKKLKIVQRAVTESDSDDETPLSKVVQRANQKKETESDSDDKIVTTKVKVVKRANQKKRIECDSDDEVVIKKVVKPKPVKQKKSIIDTDTESDTASAVKNVRKRRTIMSSDSDSEVVVSNKADRKKPAPVDEKSGSEHECYNNMNADISNFFLNTMSSFEERQRLLAEEEENPTVIMEEDSSADEMIGFTKTNNNTANARNPTRNGIKLITGHVQYPTYHRTGLRPILDDSELAWETIEAKRHESNRERLLAQKTKMMEEMFSDDVAWSDKGNLHLDYDSGNCQMLSVHPKLVKSLKEYQREGVQFMYDVCFGGIDTMDQFPGSGCILAHCMGLGKTVQIITLIHTIIQSDKLGIKRILVLCPKSTVMNWVDEIEKWTNGIKMKYNIEPFVFPDNSKIKDKLTVLKRWHNCGLGGRKAGVLMIGYEAFRTLIFRKDRPNMKASENASIRKTIYDCLLCPGPDLVVCDEGHIIKNPKSATNKAVTQIITPKRIVLTGTPIQNNLKEYYCMVNFIKPCYLGTENEFNNLYANPIKEGQHNDSLPLAIKVMKQRSYILNKTLASFVQRKEQGVLKNDLPKKFEYVIGVPLTEVQVTLYSYYLTNNYMKDELGGKTLMLDYAALRKVWTHPRILELARKKALFKKMKEEARTAKILGVDSELEDDDGDEEGDDETRECVNSVTSDWWNNLIHKADLESIESSNKFKIVFEILKECESKEEKCLIFSSYVTVLDAVEDVMRQIHTKTEYDCPEGLKGLEGPWTFGRDYYRIDGQTPRDDRHNMIKKFNDPHNHRTKCFLISSKAGGQGINLTGANRAIILDTSWNPATDQQCIFRIYRLGQERTCYIYRLLAMGTMEDKIYSRSVTKQALSGRVVDTQQIDRHYSMAELEELYELTITNYEKRPIPIKPEDEVLTTLLVRCPELAYKYHQHETLLQDKPDEALTDAEKNEAWEAYRRDSVISATTGFNDAKANKSNKKMSKRSQRQAAMEAMFNYGEDSPTGSMDSDNENYNLDHNEENYDTNNVIVPARTNIIQSNINDMINNVERDIMLRNQTVMVEENGNMLPVAGDYVPDAIIQPSGMVNQKRAMTSEENDDNKRFKMM